MKSHEEIHDRLTQLEVEADKYEDSYEENFVAIQSLRWILGFPPIPDERPSRRED